MQKTSKVYDQFMSTFSDSFRFGSIQCVKRTVVKCFKSDSCATQMYNLVKGKVKHISGFFTITYHKSIGL